MPLNEKQELAFDLVTATMNNHLTAVRKLVKFGVNANMGVVGIPLLCHAAAANASQAMLTELMRGKANPLCSSGDPLNTKAFRPSQLANDGKTRSFLKKAEKLVARQIFYGDYTPGVFDDFSTVEIPYVFNLAPTPGADDRASALALLAGVMRNNANAVENQLKSGSRANVGFDGIPLLAIAVCNPRIDPKILLSLMRRGADARQEIAAPVDQQHLTAIALAPDRRTRHFLASWETEGAGQILKPNRLRYIDHELNQFPVAYQAPKAWAEKYPHLDAANIIRPDQMFNFLEMGSDILRQPLDKTTELAKKEIWPDRRPGLRPLS